ncbi:MAG: hypothetical protein WCA56_23940 [Xanthobacteraceae bacterium]|jgi:hypothetical protein
MAKSAADEIGEWADQFRRWAKGARTQDQRLTLQSLERLFDDAAVEVDMEAGEDLDAKLPRSPAPTHS